MTGFILGFFAFYFVGVFFEWRLMVPFAKKEQLDRITAIKIVLFWPLIRWLIVEDQD